MRLYLKSLRNLSVFVSFNKGVKMNEVLKKILGIGKSLDGYIFILDLLQLNFRKVKLKKRKNCFCK